MPKIILSIMLLSVSVVSITTAQEPQPPPPSSAPSVELNSASILRAQTILKGKPIVFRNGKFELE